jgi:hypothetical protein
MFCLVLCTFTLAWAAPPTAEDIIGHRLGEMFTAGFGRGASSLKAAQKHYEAAQDQSGGDPRVEYAYGLVLLKQLKNKEALAQFQAATKQAGPEFWPAWQALVWSHLVAKDYAEGYLRLTEFAKRLAGSTSDLSERQQSAEWIGQVIAALQKSVDTVKQREALVREDETLKEILGAALGPSLARGKSSVNSLHELMEEDVQQTREQALAKEAKEQAEKQAQVAKDLEASAEKKESLKKSAEEMKKYLDDQLISYDKQLSRLERDYEFLQKRVLSLSASQVQTTMEIQLLSNVPSNNRSPTQNTLNQNVADQRRALLEALMFRYQVELDQTLAGTVAVSQRAQMLVGQRAAAVKQYERSTGQILQQESSLEKWQERLKTDGEKVKASPKGKSVPVANKIKQARSFRTYVNLDLNLERDRVLDSFGVTLPDLEDGKPAVN